MKRAWLAMIGIPACGGSVLSPTDGSTSDATPIADASSSSSDGSMPADSGTTTSGDAGMSDPKSITCNGMPCAVPANYCCDVGMLPNPGMMTCVPSTTSSCGGLRRACDETADCDPGSVCCIPPNAAIAVAYNAQCVPSAQCSGMDPYSYRLCKSSSECPANVKCITQPCHGYTISSCGGIQPQRCQ